MLMGKRNATVKFCHVLHVAHKHELQKLTMTRILSQASGGYFNLSILFTRYVGLYIHVYIITAVTTFFLLSNLWQILDVGFLLSVSIACNNFESYDEGRLSYYRVPGKAALKLVVHQYSLSVCIVSSVTDNCST